MTSIFDGKFRVTSGYRLPDRPNHYGYDIVGDESDVILSPYDGVVKSSTIITDKSNLTWEWGNYVRIDRKDGLRGFLCHMDSRAVVVGQKVKKGQKLGIMGNTGYSFGKHTHVEFRWPDGTKVNPEEILGIPNKKGSYNSMSDSSYLYKGIDVSKYQGDIDWDKVKESGIDFAIIRAGYGMYDFQIDPKFERNYSECKRLGVPVGTYWYSYATTVEEAKKEAEVYLKALNGKTTELPNWFDQEYEPSIKALTKQTRTDICKTFMNKIKESGFKTGLYCSYDWIKNWLDGSQLTEYDKWIAQYASSCSYSGSDFAMWQYSSEGKVNGISGNVDMDYCYKDYISKEKTGSWKKNDKGWWYEWSDGTYPTNDWLKVDNRWYWFDSRGYCVKGYQTIKGKNYYFAEKYALDNTVKECQLIMTDGNGAIL